MAAPILARCARRPPRCGRGAARRRGRASGASASGAIRAGRARGRRRCTSRRARAVRRLTRGYNALAADLYWIRAIQYYGGAKRRLRTLQAAGAADASRAPDYQLLYPLLDLTTTLDPRFNIAYRFGAIFLAEPYPGGAGRPDLAIALLEKGLRGPTR